ncbi:UNVERIFIED_ORG: hypothetical protein J2W85_005119 [Ensifer adhaerens]|nr:hypothetical protein [Ensifer adhaerens]
MPYTDSTPTLQASLVYKAREWKVSYNQTASEPSVAGITVIKLHRCRMSHIKGVIIDCNALLVWRAGIH